MSDMLLIEELKRIVRVRSADAELELQGLVEACKKELELAGIYGDEADPLYRQAVRLYCKSHYGYRTVPGGIWLPAGCNGFVRRLYKGGC